MIELFRRCVCDDCGKHAPEALESESPVELAQDEGWICLQYVHFCPDCAKKKGLVKED